MRRNRTRRSVSLSLVFTSAVVAASFAPTGEARAQNRYGRLGFFPGRLTGSVAASDPTQCGVASYCGGPVLSNVQIVTVYWTDQVAQATTQWAPGYASTITSSALLDMLSEYSTAGQTGAACGMLIDGGMQYFGPSTPFSTGQTITRGSATQAYTITPTQQTGTTITDDNAAIGLELAGQIAAGNLPKPQYDAQGYPDTLYVVYFPANISIQLLGMGSCSFFGGYHYSAPYAASGCKGQYLPYAVIPDCGGEGDQLSGVVSHELAEAVTDTDVGPTSPPNSNYGDGAWYLGPTNPCNAQNNGQNCPQTCGEVGDVCEGSGENTIPGTSISSQNIWSQVQNNCAVNNASIGTQTGPSPVSVCTSGSGSGSSSGSGSGSGSGSSSGSSSGSGSGSGSGGSSGGGSGSGSGSSSSSGSSGSSGTGSSSGGSGSGGVDASTPFEDAGTADAGGNGAAGSGSSSGCACDMTGTSSSGGFAAMGALLGLALLGRSRRR